MKQFNYKEYSHSKKIFIGRLFLIFVIFFFTAFILSSRQQIFAQTVGEKCGNPANQGFCEKIGVCACPGGNTLGKGGVCGQTLECCSPNYPGNANNCPAAPAANTQTGGSAVTTFGGGTAAGGTCSVTSTGALGGSISQNGKCNATTGVNNGCPGATALADGACSTGFCCVSNPTTAPPAVIPVFGHFEGIGNGVNADGTPENANPQNKTAVATILLNGSPTSSQNATPLTSPTVNSSTANAPQTAGNATGGNNAATQPGTGILTYNTVTGLYENSNFLLPNISPGPHKMILHVDKYLNRQMQIDQTGTITIPPTGKVADTGVTEMVPGDIAPLPHGDNIIDIQDYNTMVGCIGKADASICPDLKVADLNGDGVVDQKDLYLLQGHFGATGASFTTQQFVCTQDPTCSNGSSTIQLCPLQCKIETIPSN